MTWLFPAAAALVAGVFAVMLARRWLARRRPFDGYWAIAMAMYSTASSCLAIGAAAGWGDATFRGYWLFGAILTVPFLAAGEALLLFDSPRMRRTVAVSLALLSLAAVAGVLLAPTVSSAYASELPRGSEVFADASVPLLLTRVYAYTAFVLLVAGALWSAWRMRGKPELRGRFTGTLLIALGASVVAAGSVFAASGALTGFSLTLLVGISAMFSGSLIASRRPSP